MLQIRMVSQLLSPHTDRFHYMSPATHDAGNVLMLSVKFSVQLNTEPTALFNSVTSLVFQKQER